MLILLIQTLKTSQFEEYNKYKLNLKEVRVNANKKFQQKSERVLNQILREL